MFKRKHMVMSKIEFDKENQKAVVKCSICNGEQVAGFQDIRTGKITEVMVIKNENDLRQFMKQYHLESVEKVY